MTQAYLYLRYRGTSGKYAAFKEVNRQLIKIGNDFGEYPSAGSTEHVAENQIINWENDIYAVVHSGVFKFDVANNGPWTLFHTFANPNTTAAQADVRMGLTPCSIDGDPVLVTAYVDAGSSSTFRVVKIYPTGVVEGPATVGAAIFGTADHFHGALSYRNKVCWASSPDVSQYDLKTDSYQSASFTASASVQPALCVFKDRLYAHFQRGASEQLSRIDGTATTAAATIPFPINTHPESAGATDRLDEDYCQQILIPHGSGMILFKVNDRAAQAEMYHHALLIEFADGETLNGVVTDISSGVFPDSSWYDGTWNTSHRRPRFTIRQDPITSGVDNPQYTIEYSKNSTQTESASPNDVELYSWAPPNGRMQFIDAGLNHYTFSRINNTNATGGPYIWPGSGSLNIGQPQLFLNGDDIDVTFTLYGPSATGVSVHLIYDKEGEFIEATGTIIATSAGNIVNNTVKNLTADNSSQVTVKWAALQDGVVFADNPKVAGRIFIP